MAVIKPPDGRLDVSSLERYQARRRAEKIARLRGRYGAGWAITPECVSLALQRFEKIGVNLNFLSKGELFYALQRVLHTTDKGAALSLYEFSSSNTGIKVVRGLYQCKLIECTDWDSWKPTDYDFKKAKARRFLPTSELLLANAGLEVVTCLDDYFKGRFAPRLLTTRSSVEVDPSSGVTIPENVINRLREGTGLRFDLERALPYLDGLTETQKMRALRSSQQALTCLGNTQPLHAEWRQNKTGRFYASEPALLSLPKLVRNGLVSLDGHQVAGVDYDSFEFRIACSLSGIQAPPDDCAQYIGDRIGLDRALVKSVVNPMLHLQTQGNLVGMKQWEKLEHRRTVEEFIQSEWPPLVRTIKSLRDDPGLLQRRGAELFFGAYGEALAVEDIPAGIPWHDGWVFPARDEAQAIRVKGIFEEMGEDILGQPIPAKLRLLN